MANLVHARLADASHRMPHPFRQNTDFPAEGQTIDMEDPAWMQLVKDGSLVVDPIEAPAAQSLPGHGSAGKRKEKN
ncbi:hypothetical protein NKH71_03255 [Mesorhizobium sp. M0983]|uniref:hypothetical protein n=1 Tax=Mesorhizobium sp. M0983 TaxID=2957040 RepID=UPI003335CE56